MAPVITCLYLPLNAISNARIEVHYSRDKEFIYFVNCSFNVNGKRNKFRMDTSGRGHVLSAEANGEIVIEEIQKFVDLLNE